MKWALITVGISIAGLAAEPVMMPRWREQPAGTGGALTAPPDGLGPDDGVRGM